jgi:hypothetical protein
MERTSEACYTRKGDTIVVTGEESTLVNLLVLEHKAGRAVEITLKQDELVELIDALKAVQA